MSMCEMILMSINHDNHTSDISQFKDTVRSAATQVCRTSRWSIYTLQAVIHVFPYYYVELSS